MRIELGVRTPTSPTKGVRLQVAGTALLLIDVVNDLAFNGSDVLVKQAEAMSIRLAAFTRRARAAGLPVVYVNDNFGQWRSDFRQTVAHCTAPASPGRVVSTRLRPTSQDYFVLKPKHSGFYDTTLETLLEDLSIKRVIVTGIAGNICVLFTANDAYMRGMRIYAPADCIVSNTAEDNAHALRQIEVVLKGRTEPSTHLVLARATTKGRSRTKRSATPLRRDRRSARAE